MGRLKPGGKNSVGRGSLIGALSGFAIGGLIEFALGDDPKDKFLAFTAAEKALALGVYGAGAGAGIGAVYGAAVKISIPINGDLDLFNQNKDKLRKYSIKK